MPKFAPDKIRNVAFLGHSHEGKTTLAEAILHAYGAIPRMGSTDAGNATLDFEVEEQQRKMTITTGVGHVEFDGQKLNILDTPGFFDFTGQVLGALSAAEAAVIVVSANSALSVGTEIAWQRLGTKPRLVVVNKMDKENADFLGIVAAMREILKPKPVAIQLPIGAESGFKGVVDLLTMRAHVVGADGKAVEGDIPAEMKGQVEEYHAQLVEAAAEGDDELLEKYLEEGDLNAEEVRRGLSEGVTAGRVCPVVCCSATKLLGVRTLVNTIFRLFPAPADLGGPNRAFIFNTTADQFGRVSYAKVLAGSIKPDMHLFDSRDGGEDRIGGLFHLRGKEHVPAGEVGAGDICGIAKLTHALTGDTVGDKGAPAADPIQYPEPVFSVAVFARSRSDDDKIGTGLARLTEEDPTLHIERPEETHQMVLSGYGDQHIDVALDRLRRKYGVEAVTEVPRVAYRETVAATARQEGRHVKQSGGHGQYAVCTIEVSPTARGEGFVWEDRIFGGSIPQNFRPSVEKGVVDQMAKGAVAGHKMVDVKVALIDGKYHSVDSSDMAFQLAGAMAMRQAAMHASPVILEPVLEVEVRVPERFLGDVMSDLNGKRGKIAGTDPDDGWQTVKATVPEGELHRFALDLRSITQGRGSFTRRFSHYEEMPHQQAKALIDAFQKEHGSKDEHH